jgi:hypothetical protein
MRDQIPERDWKYMRNNQEDLLNTLADRINRRALAILSEETISAHKRYLKLYRHIIKSDKIVADCFNDWRRSNLILKLLQLRRHSLLTDKYLENLSEPTRKTIEALMRL